MDTPLYRAKLSEKGAAVTSFVLKNYRETIHKDSPRKELLSEDVPIETAVIGFAGKSLSGLDNAVFSTNINGETINIQDSAQEITFSWKSEKGVVVEKTYTFSPDSYVIGLDVGIKNGSNQTIQDELFVTLTSTVPNDNRMYGFEGPAP